MVLIEHQQRSLNILTAETQETVIPLIWFFLDFVSRINSWCLDLNLTTHSHRLQLEWWRVMSMMFGLTKQIPSLSFVQIWPKTVKKQMWTLLEGFYVLHVNQIPWITTFNVSKLVLKELNKCRHLLWQVVWFKVLIVSLALLDARYVLKVFVPLAWLLLLTLLLMEQVSAVQPVPLINFSMRLASIVQRIVKNVLTQQHVYDVLQLIRYQMELVLKHVLRILSKKQTTISAFVLNVTLPAWLVLAEVLKDAEVVLQQTL